MNAWVLVSVVALSGVVSAQDEVGRKPGERPKVAAVQAASRSASPVTRGDFYAACNRLTVAADRVVHVKPEAAVAVDRPQDPITRAEVLNHLQRLLTHYKPSFRSVPRPTTADHEAIRQRNPASVQPVIEALVAWGFVAPVGPLVVGPGDTLTATQAGDALGYFFSQVSLLSHRADPKWTPRLQPLGNGG